MNYIEKLTELQKELGYSAGPISPIALLGLFGEAGEVLEETTLDRVGMGSSYLDEAVFRGVQIAKVLDSVKKEIRKGNITVKENEVIAPSPTAYHKELADVFYYLNILCLNDGITIEDLARLSFDKVNARKQENIQNGVKP